MLFADLVHDYGIRTLHPVRSCVIWDRTSDNRDSFDYSFSRLVNFVAGFYVDVRMALFWRARLPSWRVQFSAGIFQFWNL